MPDRALAELNKLIDSLSENLANHYNEADTRVKFIDPLLTDVLQWNEHLHIRREESYKDCEERRCIDYILSLQYPILVVEAKKSLKQFEIPTVVRKVKYSLSGVIRDWRNAWDAITQAQQYCVDKGARYALVTNGHQYIVFKAVSETGPWSRGNALVLGSPEILRQNFTLFYECLSREAITQDKLSDFAFPREQAPKRQKPRADILASNSGYRNQLYTIIDSAFRDVLLDVPQGEREFLRMCYCSSEDAMHYTGHLNSAIADPLPLFRAPIEQVRPGHRKDAFDMAIVRSSEMTSAVPLFVVMGGIGVGKTSFLHWYFDEQMPEKARRSNLVIFCDYRTIEATVDELHARTLRIVIDDLVSQTEGQTTHFNQLCEIFRTRIDRALRGALRPFADSQEERDRRIGELLQRFQDYSVEHLEALVNFIRARMGSRVIIVLDNMDQKSPELQDKLYQIGHEFVYRCNLVVVISLREATYRRISKAAIASAFASREFHVKGQPIDLILGKRFEYLQSRLPSQKVHVETETGVLDVVDFDRFVTLMQRSLLSERADPRILECITALSNADTRRQLRMIYSFLISGQTKIADYFWKYAAKDRARIPFHEVLHSILYQDSRFFDEGGGDELMNVLEPAPGMSASHFSALRILSYMQNGLGQTGDLRPTDFITSDELYAELGDYGLSREETAFQFQRLAHFGLIMPESGLTTDAIAPQPCALSRCGIYYLRNLYSDFTYFSAMAVDTSMTDHEAANSIAAILRASLAGPKMSLQVRRRIAERFLGYLDFKEHSESSGAIRQHPVVGRTLFVPSMIAALRRIPAG